MSLCLEVTTGRLRGHVQLPGDSEVGDVSLVLGALATVDCQGDPWLTWVACIVSLSADYPTRLTAAAPVFRLYPGTNGDLFVLGVRVERQECSDD